MSALLILSTVKESATLFWSGRNSRERIILASAGLAVVLCLIYAIFFAPAMNGRAQLNQDLPALRQQVAELQALSKQAAELHNAGAAVTPVTQESIAASLVSRGMKPLNVVVTEDLVRVQLNPASFAGLVGWIDEQQKTAHMIVIDANFVALAQTDMVNATLTLKQQRGEEKLE